MPAHTPEKPPEESEQRPPDWKPPPPPKPEGPIEARAVRATFVDEVDSDDRDDDEREWSLRHALDEFGVTKVRVKGKQGVALFGSEKDASMRHAARQAGRLAPARVRRCASGDGRAVPLQTGRTGRRGRPRDGVAGPKYLKTGHAENAHTHAQPRTGRG